jgi:4-aminobutyrate aminotransferase
MTAIPRSDGSLDERWRRVIAPTLGVATTIEAVRAEGPWVEAAGGRRYLDFASGTATANLGHNHPRVVAAAREQMERMVHSGGVFRYESAVALAERLARITPGDIGSFFFLNGGSEAVEGAVKLARRVTGRHGVVVFRGGFHGRTQGSVGYTTSKSYYRAGYAPLGGSVYVAPFPTPYRWGTDMDDAVDRALVGLHDLHHHELPGDETACYLVEPVQGEGGYHPAGARFLEALRERADRVGALLVFDEVQTGFGRTGEWFAAQTYGVTPDVVAMAKGIANGFPVSAIGASPELMARWPTGAHGTTFGGNPIACAAGAAVIDTVDDEGLLARGRELGARATHRLKALEAEIPEVAEVRGPGLMIGIEFADPGTRAPLGDLVARVVAAAEEEGLVLIDCSADGNVVRFIPPLVTSDEDLELGLSVFERAVGRALG